MAKHEPIKLELRLDTSYALKALKEFKDSLDTERFPWHESGPICKDLGPHLHSRDSITYHPVIKVHKPA
jgi:hypothetical protein